MRNTNMKLLIKIFKSIPIKKTKTETKYPGIKKQKKNYKHKRHNSRFYLLEFRTPKLACLEKQ